MPPRRLIAIDATSAPPLPAGAGRYTLSLIQAMARVDTEHDYVIYARRHSLAVLSDLGHSFQVVDIGPKSRAARYVWEQTRLAFDLRRRGVVLLHSTHHTTPIVYLPCPSVVTIHDATFFVLPQRYTLVRRLYFQLNTWLSVRRARAIIVPSRSSTDDLRTYLHPPAQRIHITPEGVDSGFHPLDKAECVRLARERYGLPEGYLLSVGTREPGKNRPTLLRAFRHLLDQGRDLHLAIVGQDGWRSHEDEAALHELGLSGRVRFTGYVPQADLPALYNAASVFVFPSLYEGFGLPPLEAMACGTPVVTSNVSSLPEVVGDATLLIDPLDAGAIAAAVARILDQPALAETLRQVGLDRAAGFSWEDCAAATLSVYRQVLGET
ncbi:MAG: glycosyltransferase [Dehalococcoidia bacterium]|nr:glycosyltransferase [Dehalococcoidia bacterium]